MHDLSLLALDVSVVPEEREHTEMALLLLLETRSTISMTSAADLIEVEGRAGKSTAPTVSAAVVAPRALLSCKCLSLSDRDGRVRWRGTKVTDRAHTHSRLRSGVLTQTIWTRQQSASSSIRVSATLALGWRRRKLSGSESAGRKALCLHTVEMRGPSGLLVSMSPAKTCTPCP